MHTKSLGLFLFTALLVLSASGQSAETDGSKSSQTVEQLRLEDTLLQERENIRKEQEEISLRKKELKTLEESVDKRLADMDRKLAELNRLQIQIERLLKKKSAEEAKRLKSLATIYEKMSPQKAALALAELDKQLAANLLASMKVKAAAKILDQTAKQKTTELSTSFTTLQLE